MDCRAGSNIRPRIWQTRSPSHKHLVSFSCMLPIILLYVRFIDFQFQRKHCIGNQSEETLPSWNPPPDFLQKSVKTCFEHAKAISTIMAEVISRSDCIVTAPFLGFAMFTANLFHLHQAFTPCPYVDESPEAAREYFAIGVTVLNELRTWWGPLEMLYNGIRLLWQAKARNSQIQITNEQETPKGVTQQHHDSKGNYNSGLRGTQADPPLFRFGCPVNRILLDDQNTSILPDSFRYQEEILDSISLIQISIRQ